MGMTVQELIDELMKVEDKSKELDSPKPFIIGAILFILGIIAALGSMALYIFTENIIFFGVFMLGILFIFLGIVIASLGV